MTDARRRPALLIVATHPIQYHAPLFRALAGSNGVDLTVGFLDLPDPWRQGVGFGLAFAWDVPLTEGYRSVRLDAVVADGDAASTFRGRRWRHPIRDLRALAPDVVLVMGWNQIGLLQGWLAARWLGVPIVVRGESNAKRKRAGWKRIVHRLLLSIPDRFLAIGLSNRRFYLESGVDVSGTEVAPYFVDNSFFATRAAAVDRRAQRQAWGIVDDDLCLLFAGKFEQKKRPFDLLAAVTALPAETRARIVVLMVGAGPLEAGLRAQVATAGLRVTWAGFLNQTGIPAAYAAADVLVLPSDHGETWGLVVNEAMACGLPAIVSSEVGCADDLVRHGETGLVFPVGDVHALAAAIMAMVDEPERRRAMGAAARVVVHDEYTIERSVDAIAATVSTLAGRARAGSATGPVPR
jgi:glycosyltransferase involved in cell wall biosynthesis